MRPLALLISLTLFFGSLQSAQATSWEDEQYLYALSCEMPLGDNEAAISEAETLLIALAPSPFQIRRMSHADKQKFLIHRARIKACLLAQLGRMVDEYRNNTEQSLTLNRHRQFHTLQFLAGNVMNGLHEVVVTLPSEYMLATKMRGVYQMLQQPISFTAFLPALHAAPSPIEDLDMLAFVIHDELNPESIEPELIRIARSVAAIPVPENRGWATRMLLQIFARNLFHLTARGLDEYKNTLHHHQAENRHIPPTAKPSDILQKLSEIISPNGTDFDRIVQAVKAANDDGMSVLGHNFQENDILMDSRVDGFGQFFQFVIQTPAMYGHQAVIVAEAIEDWIAYYRAEIQGGLHYASITPHLANILHLRLDVTYPRFFIDEKLQKLEQDNIRFDAGFSTAGQGLTGDHALYCSEFMDQIMQPAAIFPHGAEPLADITPQFVDNMTHIGVAGEGDFFLSDRIIQDADMRMIGLMAHHRITEHPSAGRLRKDLYLDFHRQLLQGTRDRPYRPLSWFDRIKLFLIMQWSEATGQTEFTHIEFSGPYQKLFFMNALMIMKEVEQLTAPLATQAARLPLSTEDITAKQQHYERVIQPRITALFEG